MKIFRFFFFTKPQTKSAKWKCHFEPLYKANLLFKWRWHNLALSFWAQRRIQINLVKPLSSGFFTSFRMTDKKQRCHWHPLYKVNLLFKWRWHNFKHYSETVLFQSYYQQADSMTRDKSCFQLIDSMTW